MDGKNESFGDGFEKGKGKGYNQGYNQVFHKGYYKGYDEGYDEGYVVAFEKGHAKGNANVPLSATPPFSFASPGRSKLGKGMRGELFRVECEEDPAKLVQFSPFSHSRTQYGGARGSRAAASGHEHRTGASGHEVARSPSPITPTEARRTICTRSRST